MLFDARHASLPLQTAIMPTINGVKVVKTRPATVKDAIRMCLIGHPMPDELFDGN